MYDDLGLFRVFFFFFGRREVLEAIDEFNDLQYLASTNRLLLLVAGAVLACVLLYFLKAFFSLFLHFMVYSVETVTGAF